MREVYVMISRTKSNFGKLIRLVTGTYYNHAAIAFDEDLQELYSFVRRQYDVPINAGLQRESIAMYTLGQSQPVDVVIFRIPVEEETYHAMRRAVFMMQRDGEYLYNLFSALTFPLLHGVPAYKAYTCIEFVCLMLLYAGIPLEKLPCRYHPQDLLTLLHGYEYYRGDLLAYRDFQADRACDPAFFRHQNPLQAAWVSAPIVAELIGRQIGLHPHGSRSA